MSDYLDVSAVQLRSVLTEVVRLRGYTRAEEPFKLSSGGTSFDYVDMRRAVARGADLALAAQAVIATLDEEDIEFDAIGGMTMGADPVSHAVAMLADARWFSVRKAEKGHGTKNRIEGARLDSETRAVIFEDTISTGRSVLEALDVAQQAGANVVCALTLLDRGESARKLFVAREVPYLALMSYHDLAIEPLN